MKKVFNVCRNIFAVLGVIATILFVVCLFAIPYLDVYINPTRLGMMDEYVD